MNKIIEEKYNMIVKYKNIEKNKEGLYNNTKYLRIKSF